MFAVDAATGDQEWAFTYPSSRIGSAPTVIDDPEAGDSVGSRVARGTLEHHHVWADNSPAVTGTVLGKVTSDAGEQLAEVEVTLVNKAGEATSTYTGADGSYAVEVVPGTYDLVVEELGFAPFETVVVHEHLETERDIDLPSLKPGGLRGAVTDVDSDPLADVEIRCYHDGTLIDTATTDGTGEYALALAVGLYEVVATADGYAPVSEPVEIEEDTQTFRDFELVEGAPSLPGHDDRPRDLNGDELFEDIDGDGEFDIFDVQTLFNGLDSDAVQNHPEAFNFNEDENPEDVTIFDVQELFNRLAYWEG